MGVRGWGEARQSHLIRGRGGHSKRVGENSQRNSCKGCMAFVLRDRTLHPAGAGPSPALAHLNPTPALPFSPCVTRRRSLPLSDPHFLTRRTERMMEPSSEELCDDSVS